MKRFVFFIIGSLFFINVFAQSDSTSSDYDTVYVTKPTVVVKQNVLYLTPKTKLDKQVLAGLSVGLNYFSNLYYTCPNCSEYASYARTVAKSQLPGLGFNVTLYRYRNITRKLFYDTELRYSFFSEKFSADQLKATNIYQQLGFSASLLYQIKNTEKNKLFIGVGGNVQYLLSAEGKTVTIYQAQLVENMNSFRIFNKWAVGTQISFHWMRQIDKRLYFLLNTEVLYEITSFTSYHEYYLQNRFLYSVNLGLLRKF
jgi:hypothetical protein